MQLGVLRRAVLRPPGDGALHEHAVDGALKVRRPDALGAQGRQAAADLRLVPLVRLAALQHAPGDHRKLVKLQLRLLIHVAIVSATPIAMQVAHRHTSARRDTDST